MSRRVILHLFFAVLIAVAAGDRALADQPDGNPKQGLMAKVGSDLAGLFSEYETHLAQNAEQEFLASGRFSGATGSWVLIDAVASGDASVLQSELEGLGLRNGTRYRSIVSGEIPVAAIGKTAALDSLKYAVPSYYATSATDVGRSSPRSEISRVSQTYGNLPLSFESNEGQTDPRVKFLSRGSGYTLFLTNDEAVLALRKPARHEYLASEDGSFTGDWSLADEPATIDTVHMRLVGANTMPEIEGLDELPGKSNYFIGNDPEKWHTNVSNYAKVKYREVYPGVDLVYYGNQRQLEYDFVVAPGTDPGVLRLGFEGADQLELDDEGNLILRIEGGEVVLKAPFIYQEVNGVRRSVAGSYVLQGSKQVGFQVGTYDPSKPLVIDPVLVYSTYLGGSNLDLGTAVTVDALGNAYITGRTRSTDFPTVNPIQPSPIFSQYDVFVTKLNPTGTQAIYSTYLGGGGDDLGTDIAVDDFGNVYVVGDTPGDFPIQNAFQPVFGGFQDAFVAKLDPTGSALVYSTYLGGSGNDQGSGIAADESGNAYVTGLTGSTNFPTENPYQGATGGGFDIFITKLNPTGETLVYSTYLGGSNPDIGHDIAVDAFGNAYITGETSSIDFPTVSPLQSSFSGPIGTDAFIAKLNATGADLTYSTYLGGPEPDIGHGIAVDDFGNAYIAGDTRGDFPTVNALQPTFDGGGSFGFDGFAAKLNASGSTLIYATYLGGSNDDFGHDIATDSAGNAYVTGYTESFDFPVANALQSEINGALRDAFVTKIDSTGSGLTYSTYIGGTGQDTGHGIAVDASGSAYITGWANSIDFPTTTGAFQPTPPEFPNAFVFKIAASSFHFNAATYNANENDSNATITITRKGDSDGQVKVDYATSNGTAVAGADYIATSGTITFADGDLADKTFIIPIIDDSLIEGDETVNLTLSNPTGSAAVGSPNPAVLTIADFEPVIGQGDAAMRSDDARASFGVDGTGITVGTLSDSFDCLGGATSDVANEELPPGISVLEEIFDCTDGTDEGRAMMQIIHDVAPGANQMFHSAANGIASFAQGITDLANAGADVIVDDVIYLIEPMFQDGIIAQAVDDVVNNNGVAYFSAAFNNGRDSYESGFNAGTFFEDGFFPSAPFAPAFFEGTAHDFGGGDVFQRITVPEGSGFRIPFQWDSPYFSASGINSTPNDLDIYLLDDPATTVLAGSIFDNINLTGDPIEFFSFFNPVGSGQTQFNLIIMHFEGPFPGLMKYVVFDFGPDPVTIDEFETSSSTIFGHANAAGAEAVGAASFLNTPEFGVSPPLIEDFSAAGPTPIFFEADGTPTSENRDKPEIVGPDDVNTTFFGSDIIEDPDTFPNFAGTSAAAPHAAGVAALMLEADPTLTPELVYSVLEITAIDMDDPFTPGFDTGFDFGTGFGFIQADLAVQAVLPDLIITMVDSQDPIILGDAITYTLKVTNVGTATSTAVKITDTLPADVSFDSASTTQGTFSQSGITVTFELGDISTGAMASSTIVVVPTKTGTFTNSASVSSDEPVPNTIHDTVTQDTTVNPAVVITKEGDLDSLLVNETLTYTLKVTAVGTATSTAVKVTDILPAEVNFVSATSTRATISQSGNIATFEFGDLVPGDTAVGTITVTATAAGTVTNTASVSTNQPFTDTVHDAAMLQTTINTVQEPENGNGGGGGGGGAAARPVIAFDLESVTFTATKGGDNPEPQILKIWTSKSRSVLRFSVSTDVDWLSASPIEGLSDAPNDKERITLSADISGMNEGTHTGTVTISARRASNDPQTVGVTLVVNTPPPVQPEFTAADVEDLSNQDAARFLSELTKEERTAFFEEISTAKLTEIVNTLDEGILIESMPEMSVAKFQLIPLEVRLNALRSVPTEQIVPEIAPQSALALSAPVASQESPTTTSYTISETVRNGWTPMVESLAPLERMLGKFTKRLTDLRVVVEDLDDMPSRLPGLTGDKVINSMFRIDVGNPNPEDLSVVHITLFVEKSWLVANDIHMWSIQLNRYDEELGAWVSFPTKRVRENGDRIIYTVVVPGFSVFALTGSSELPESKFEVSNLEIIPQTPEAGEKVRIQVRVRNSGADREVYPANLWLNETIENSEMVVLEAGETKSVGFTISKPEGFYSVRIERLFGEVDVSSRQDTFVLAGEPTGTAIPARVKATPTPTTLATPTATPVPAEVFVTASTPTAVPTAVSQPTIVAAVAAAPAPLPILNPTAIPVPEQLVPSQPGGGLSVTVIVVLIIVGIAVAAGTTGVALSIRAGRRAS